MQMKNIENCSCSTMTSRAHLNQNTVLTVACHKRLPLTQKTNPTGQVQFQSSKIKLNSCYKSNSVNQSALNHLFFTPEQVAEKMPKAGK